MSLLTGSKDSFDSFGIEICPLEFTVKSACFLTVISVGVCVLTKSLGHAKIDADWS